MKKEDNLISSQVLSEFYKTALDKGWLPKEELTKNASVETDRYSPTGNLIQDLVNLAFGLREAGLYSQAEVLENKINVFKKAQYEMHNLIDQNSMALQQHAHPESAKVVETQSGWGMIHTNIDRQRKILETLTHQPKGVHQEAVKSVALAAAEALGLLKFAQEGEDSRAAAERELAGEEAGEAAPSEEMEEPSGLLPSGKLVDPDMARKVKANKKAVRTASAGILKSLSEINSELNKIKSGKIFSKEAILKSPTSNLAKIYLEANGFNQEELAKNYSLYQTFGETEASADNAIAGMKYSTLQDAISQAAPSLSNRVIGVDYEIPAAGSPLSVKVTKEKGTFDFGEQEEVIKAKSFTQDDISSSLASKSRTDTSYRRNPASIWTGKMFIDEEGVTLNKNSLLQRESVRSELAKRISEQINAKMQEYFRPSAQATAGTAMLAKYSTAINMLKKISASVKSSSLYEDRVEIFRDVAGKSKALLGYFSKDPELKSLPSGGLISGHVGAINVLAVRALAEFNANPISAELESPKVSAKKAAPILDKLSTTINNLKDLADYFKEKDPNGNDFKKTSRYYDTLVGIYQALNASKNKPWTEVQSAIAGKSKLSFKNYESLDYWVSDTKQRVDEAIAKSPALGSKRSNFRNPSVIKLGQSSAAPASDVGPVVISVRENFEKLRQRAGDLLGMAPAAAPATRPEPPKPAGVVAPSVPGIPTDSNTPGGAKHGGGKSTSGGGGGKNRESLTEEGKAIYDMQAALQDLSNKISAAKEKADPKPAGNELSVMKPSTDGAWGPQTAAAIKAAQKWISTLEPGPHKEDKAKAEANTAKIKEYIAEQGWAEGTRPGVELDRISRVMLDKSPESTSFTNSIPLKDTYLNNLSSFYNFIIKKLGLPEEQNLGWWVNVFNWFDERVEYLKTKGKLGDITNVNFYESRIKYLTDRFYSILKQWGVDARNPEEQAREVSANLFLSDTGGGGGAGGGALGGGAGGAIGGAGMPGAGGAGGAGGTGGGAGGDARISEYGYGGASDETPPFDADGINLDSPYFGDMNLGLSGGMFQSDWFKSRAFDVAIQLFASEHSDKPLTSQSYAETQNFACVNDYLEFLAKLRSAISGAYRSYLAGNAPQASKASVGRSLNAYVRAIQSHIKQLQDIIRQMQRGGSF